MSYTIDRDSCVCCHNCTMECPEKVIRFAGTSYWIDPDHCTNCGHCAEVCHVSAISDPDNPAPAPELHPLKELDCDLVVLGSGGSGLIAAVKTAQLTAKRVIVLEKAKKPGGNTNLAHGFAVFHSKWHQAAGIPDNREEVIQSAMRRCTWRLDTSIISNAVYATGPFFDWLCEFGGAEDGFALVDHNMPGFGDGPAMGPKRLDYPKRRLANLQCRDQAIGPGWAGTYVVHKMLEQCRKMDIPVLTEHRAVRLLTDDTGAVTGVLADDPGGQTRVNCRACLIATGGFGRSDAKLKKYFPEFFQGQTPIHRFSVITNTGDGMDLGEQVGAVIPVENLCVNMFGPAHHPFSYCIYRLMLQPETVYINLNGRRWIDEAAGLMGGRYRITKQPREISWAVMDQTTVDMLGRRLVNDPAMEAEAWIHKDYIREIEEELKLDTPAKRADSLEELAGLMGVDAWAFTEEIARYNDFCARGHDLDHFKDPKALVPVKNGPFYAFYGQRFSEGAFGGVKVNANTQVLNKEGKVIRGLYAAGDAASANLYRDMLGVISELTWAVSSGYLAGQQIASDLGK